MAEGESEAVPNGKRIDAELVDALPGIFFAYDMDSRRLVRWNRNCAGLSGADEGSLAGVDPLVWFREEDRQRVERAFESCREGREVRLVADLIFRDGVRPYEFAMASRRVGDGACVVAIGADRCPGDRGTAVYRDLFERGFSAIAVTDQHGSIIEGNEGFERLAGLGRGGGAGLSILSVAHPDSAPDFSLALRRIGDSSLASFSFGASLVDGGGRHSRVEVKALRLGAEDAPARVAFFVNDVTERQLAAEALESALSDKIALLQEVRHRVGNNLQIIASLMRLTKGRYRNGVNFAEAVLARVESMALLYQNTIEDSGVARIELGDFVEELMDEILGLYDLSPRVFFVETLLEDDATIDGDRIVPFGLFISEAARAFVEECGAGCRLRILLRRRDGALELEIASKAFRLPGPYYDAGSDEALLLYVLAEQLKGSLEVRDGSAEGWIGTAIAIHVPA